MKRTIYTVFLTLILVGGIIGGVKLYQANQQRKEFYAFREYLDKEFFPILKKENKFFGKVATQSDYNSLDRDLDGYSDWWVLYGMNQYYNVEDGVEKAQEKITNKNLKYEDSLALKQNVLKSLSLSKDTLESIDTLSEVNVEQGYEDKENALNHLLSEKLDKLTKNIDKQNEIIGKYYH